jgi:hypothetical protein
MGIQAKRARRDPPDRIDNPYNVVDRQLVRLACKDKPPMESALRVDDAGAAELLQYFRQVSRRNARAGCDLAGDDSFVFAGSQKHDNAQGVFGGP